MTFEDIVRQTTSYTSEDGITIEHEFHFWKPFRYNQIKWKAPSSPIPICISHVFEEKEQFIREGVIHKYLGANKNVAIPTAPQKNALVHLFNNEVQLGQAVVNFIFHEYNKLRDYYQEPEDSNFMPKLNSSAELSNLIELTTIFILYNHHQDISFIGFYFGGCQWDDEHGVGVLTYQNEIVKYGQIEEASDEYFHFH